VAIAGPVMRLLAGDPRSDLYATLGLSVGLVLLGFWELREWDDRHAATGDE
jgi:hypothetical protein